MGEPWIVVATTIGNTLGSVVNWACGRLLGH
jgi:membrane protein YqaA with SNARE-associated domain